MKKNKAVLSMLKFIHTKRALVRWGCIFFLPLAFCFSQNIPLKKISFLPLWVPQPQFAGYYMAKEKGIYEKYGLDVTIQTGGYSRDVTASLKNGEIDFGTMFLYTGVIERAAGTKLVNIGQIFQRSAIMFVAKKKSGIKSLDDFNGRRIGVWRTVVRELTVGFLKMHRIQAEVIPFNNSFNLFLKDAVDVIAMMNYNEFYRMINAGINADEVIVFNFSEYGMNFPEDGIYCMESTLKQDPEACKKFVKASIEGWKYALANANETVAIIQSLKKKAHVSASRSHASWMLSCMKEMIYPPNKNIKEGILLQSDYESLTGFLYQNGVITVQPAYGDFYRDVR